MTDDPHGATLVNGLPQTTVTPLPPTAARLNRRLRLLGLATMPLQQTTAWSWLAVCLSLGNAPPTHHGYATDSTACVPHKYPLSVVVL